MTFTAPYRRPLTADYCNAQIKYMIENNRRTACELPTRYYQCSVEHLCWDLDLLFG